MAQSRKTEQEKLTQLETLLLGNSPANTSKKELQDFIQKLEFILKQDYKHGHQMVLSLIESTLVNGLPTGNAGLFKESYTKLKDTTESIYKTTSPTDTKENDHVVKSSPRNRNK